MLNAFALKNDLDAGGDYLFFFNGYLGAAFDVGAVPIFVTLLKVGLCLRLKIIH